MSEPWDLRKELKSKILELLKSYDTTVADLDAISVWLFQKVIYDKKHFLENVTAKELLREEKE